MDKKDKAKWLVEMYQHVAEGGELERNLPSVSWTTNTSLSPNMKSHKEDWRIKPMPKYVDLSVLVDSGIDCKFWDDGAVALTRIFLLKKVYADSEYPYTTDEEVGWNRCTPRMNHWHSPRNSSLSGPWNKLIDAGFEVQTFGSISEVYSYKIIGLKEGYKYPWEK